VLHNTLLRKALSKQYGPGTFKAALKWSIPPDWTIIMS
jgi:hypothetical protein